MLKSASIEETVALIRLGPTPGGNPHPSSGNLLVYLKVDPHSVELTEGFTRDVRNIGHFGTGDLELRVTSVTQWETVEALTLRSYENS